MSQEVFVLLKQNLASFGLGMVDFNASHIVDF